MWRRITPESAEGEGVVRKSNLNILWLGPGYRHLYYYLRRCFIDVRRRLPGIRRVGRKVFVKEKNLLKKLFQLIMLRIGFIVRKNMICQHFHFPQDCFQLHRYYNNFYFQVQGSYNPGAAKQQSK